MTTIRDVSKYANVSVATVSRVLNNNGYVNDETRGKVLKAIEALDYRPNEVARSLFKGKSKMIALFVPDISNPFFPELARVVEDVANHYSYTFILCNTDNNHNKELKYLNALIQKSVDGIIMVSSTMTFDELEQIKVPIIALDRELGESIATVSVNNLEGAKQAVQYLKEIGCNKIAHISGPTDVISSKYRMDGYLEEVENEKWYIDNYVKFGEYTFEGAYKVGKELLRSDLNVEGIFVANDLMAVGVIKAAESIGIRIPHDLSVIGFDGIQIGKITSPSISTMEQPIFNMGKKAAEMLINKIEDNNFTLKSVKYDVKLIKRDSTNERR